MRSVRVRSLIITCTCVCALFLGCDGGTDYLAVDKRNRPDAGDAPDGSAASGAKRDGGGGTSGNKGNGGSRSDASMPNGARDAAIDLDASLMLPDGSVFLDDGGIMLPSGEIIDLDTAIMRYGPEVDVSTCEIADEDTWDTGVSVVSEGGFTLVPGGLGFGLAYAAIGDTCRQEIAAMPIPSIGEFSEPHSVLPDCKSIADLSLMSVKDGWLLAFVDNYTDMAELHTIALDANMKIASGEKRHTLTDNDLGFEQRPVLRSVEDQPMVAWITENTDDESPEYHKKTISTRRLDGKSDAIEVVGIEADQHPDALAFAPIGAESAAVAWVGPVESPGVWLQRLDGEGAAVDVPVQLTEKVAASSSVDLASRKEGGAVVYSIEIDGLPQVRFRRLDATGVPIGDERTLIGPPLRAQGASLHALAGGYVLAYRALPGGGVEQPEVRLTFISKEGNLMKDASGRLQSFHIGDATIADARTYVAVSVDGELMIAWLDAGSGDENVLKVVRRRLDCN